MEFATLNRERVDRKEIINHLGGMEVPWGQVDGLRWDDIPKDCLPVMLYKSANPKAVIVANRMQLDSLRKTDKEYNREFYIVEITRLLKHSNLEFCEEMIERDRKFRKKKRKLLSNSKKLLMKDIIQSLNKSRTAADIGAQYGVTAFSVNQMASKLRKPPYNFLIPGARGTSEFDVFAREIAKENPELVGKPLASKNSLKVLQEIQKTK